MSMATKLLPALRVSPQPNKSLSPSIPSSPNWLSFSAITPTLPTIYCGRGDRKTAKGKRFAHSFGNAKPRDKKKGRGPPKPPVPPGPPKKDRFSEED
ncbi:30S ribosomal protein S31 [Stylosanthes scabra]|uniref:30S ribosomal protein S31 n=1 Tax=Stylosanthes scabra TaxID=79078 RepID=A0ABU6XM99_9FABA|nr:30S ribosomal protein S31 [Stylosanthes scabra]